MLSSQTEASSEALSQPCFEVCAALDPWTSSQGELPNNIYL